MTYIQNREAWEGRHQAPPPDPEIETFVVSRLAELAVVLLNARVGGDAAALRDKAEGQVVLLALGDAAADHGRADLLRILHGLAAKIETHDRSPDMGPRFKPQWTTGRITYRW